MSNDFFAADLHLGHKKVSFARGFDSVDAHSDAVVANWNAVVSPKDTVWVLGDAIWNKPALPAFAALNGTKKLVMGNHDCLSPQTLLTVCSTVRGVVEWKHGLVLTHVPVHPCELENRWVANVHGHLHDKVLPDPRFLCVSLEQTNLRPVSLEEVLGTLKGRGVEVTP